MYEVITTQNDCIPNRYNHALERFSKDGIIDIDKRMRHKAELMINRIEDTAPSSNGFIPPCRQTPYSLIFVKNGSGVKNIGQFSVPIQKNTLFIIPTRVISSTTCHSFITSGYSLLFDIDFFLKTEIPQHCISNRKIFKNIIQPSLQLDEAQADSLILIFEKILAEEKNSASERRDMMAVKILELLMYCDRLFSQASLTGNITTSHPIVEKFKSLLEFNFTTKRSVCEYAEMLNLHPNHLNFLLKKHDGLNAKQIINNRIITESKYLLSNSNFIIKEVASQVGFDDPNNFSTFFHKSTGESPIAYRISSLDYHHQTNKYGISA